MSDYQRDHNKNYNELSNHQKSFATSMLLLLLCLVSSCMCLGTLSLHTVVVNSKLDVRIKNHCLYESILIKWYLSNIYLFVHTCLLFSQQILKKAPWKMISMNCGPIVYLVNNVVRDIHIEWSKQFKWNFYFYVSGQSQPFWAALKLL